MAGMIYATSPGNSSQRYARDCGPCPTCQRYPKVKALFRMLDGKLACDECQDEDEQKAVDLNDE